MDRKLNKRIADYVGDFKKNIKQKALDLQFQETDKIEELVRYVFEVERLVFSKDDVSKRKRIKNAIPSLNRCHARRANGEQCTRKQKEGCSFCGTHVKGTPHGIITTSESDNGDVITGEVFAEEIGGIVYYLDKHNNVFSTEDILNDKQDPKVIAQYTHENGQYHIPEFGV